MAEAEQHRQFIKRLHTLIHSERTENDRAELARAAVLSYVAALQEAAATSPQGSLRETAYVEFHLTKAHNWVVAWRSPVGRSVDRAGVRGRRAHAQRPAA